MKRFFWLGLCLVLSLNLAAQSRKKQKTPDKPWLESGNLSGLSFRLLGPALTEGRISDIAVVPGQKHTFYVAVASGGVWKTENNGTTYTPIFDGQGSYSIGCVTIDPNNPYTVWVGTGENNSQRSVGYGDGVYRSLDGGKSWEHMGLKESEHIAKIHVDPRDSNTVFVAAQGPLWSEGGERGLFKTTDGGKTWKNVLEVDVHTGVTDLVVDPRDPDVMIAATYQRRRHVWTLVNGGPGSSIHKTTDGGETWRKVTSGLPSVDLGRIGLAMAPADPDVVYAVVEAALGEGGLYRSNNRGESWKKMSSYVPGSPQYYNELVADPNHVDRVYAMDTWLHVTEDGGKSFTAVGEKTKHVDNHAMWIDPDNSDHFWVGCDGGMYESWDRGTTWMFRANLPIIQFYKIGIDQAEPFYNVYGGTQDNFTMGGPSQTTNRNGINNRDWFITKGGDGFQTRVDPTDPNILYSLSQYGDIIRFDKTSGESLTINPQPEPGADPLRWNWDSPLIISPHNHKRLYFGAQMLFRSDDRGHSWTAVSGDLTKNIDRNQLKVMGRVWSVDAVAKNKSTSVYGNLTALDESPLVEGLLYVGSDDGLVQVSENGGEAWRRIDQVGSVPESTYVNDILASQHQADRVYLAFNNHKRGDFKPYLYKSDDRGSTWTSISGNLPERGSVYAVVEDHVDPNLLFVGTEFGVFVTTDGGKVWAQLSSGLPTVAVRDIEIHKGQDDLVLGTFGRGFYILDDYSALRGLNEDGLKKEAALAAPKKALVYQQDVPLGIDDQAFQGDNFFMAKNPDFGAAFTYHLGEGYKSKKETRREQEKNNRKDGKDNPYPSWDELEAEASEEAPSVFLTVRDGSGNIVRRIEGPTGKGFHRVTWDLRMQPAQPVALKPFVAAHPWVYVPAGPLVVPGTYSVSLSKRVEGEETELVAPINFEVEALGHATFKAENPAELFAFQQQLHALFQDVLGSYGILENVDKQLTYLAAAAKQTPGATEAMRDRAQELRLKYRDLDRMFNGDGIRSKAQEPSESGLASRLYEAVYGHWLSSTSDATETQKKLFERAKGEFTTFLEQLKQLADEDIPSLQKQLDQVGAAWTPGSFPEKP